MAKLDSVLTAAHPVSALTRVGGLTMGRTHPFPAARRAPIEIGVLNNMPDALLHATERQFSHLLRAACGRHEVRVRFYSLAEVPRGEYTRIYMRTLYGELDEMFEADLDGLIVTGAETRTAELADEPYWDRLTQVIDWARANVAASYWSGLAAHAAVLHLDGVRGVPLPAKRSGVYEGEAACEDPLLAHLPTPIRTPHSRLNGLDEQELADHGYTVLTRSAEAGVDMFARRERSLMVFGQGHPEYDAGALLGEYCRDVGCFLSGTGGGAPPPVPAHYLSLRTQRALGALARCAPAPALMARYNAIAATATPRQVWRATSVALFRNWLHHITSRKATVMRAARKMESRALLGAKA